MKSPAALATLETNLDLSTTKEITVRASAKVFDIFFDKVYSKKEKAVVRETLCNADDSHRMAGTDRAIDVHLPTALDPVFRVRDYGVSMDHDTVMGLYSEAFASSKDDTNEQTGMVGIGSKAGFAVSDSFTLSCYLGGRARTYSVARNAKRLPGITPVPGLFDIETDEPDGVEVQIPVGNERHRAFEREACRLVWGFESPIDGIEPAPWRTKLEGVTPSGNRWWVLNTGGDLHPLCVRQGPVVYPVDASVVDPIWPVKGDYSFVVDIPMGSADIGPDRESLSYDQATEEFLRTVMTEADADFWNRIRAEFTAAGNWRSQTELVTDYSGWVGEPPADLAPLLKSERKLGLAVDHDRRDLFLVGKSWTQRAISPGVLAHHPLDRENAGRPVLMITQTTLVTTRRWYIARPGVVRQRERILRDARRHGGKFVVLNDPTTDEVERIIRTLGVSRSQIVASASLYDKARERREGGVRAKARPKNLTGVFNLRAGSSPLAAATELPEDYLWVPLASRKSDALTRVPVYEVAADTQVRLDSWGEYVRAPLDRIREIRDADGPVDESVRRLYRLVPVSSLNYHAPADAMKELGLPGEILGLTESAVARLSPDPARSLFTAIDSAITDDLVRAFEDRQLYDWADNELCSASSYRLDRDCLHRLHLDSLVAPGLDLERKLLTSHFLRSTLGESYYSSADRYHEVRKVVAKFQEDHPVFFTRTFTTDQVDEYLFTGSITKGAS